MKTMPSYHSKLTSDRSVGNMALLPFRTKFRGPIISNQMTMMMNGNTNGNGNGTITNGQSEPPMDIIDETLFYFKPNVFFKTYEIQSNADRVLIYLTLYIIECLKKLQRLNTKEHAIAEMHALAISRFDIPGDPGFPLNSVYAKPSTAEEQELMRQYFLQLRQECGLRLAERVFETENGKPSKWWLCFAKRKFMDITLTGNVPK
nr:actin-related protein 2/3 complex subunit 3-like isoform X3 [Dermatophagoides farinae]